MEQTQIPDPTPTTPKSAAINSSTNSIASPHEEVEKPQSKKEIELDKSANGFTPKRKKVVLSFVQKFEILDKLKAGAKVSDIAAEYNIGMTTVSDIRKHGQEKLLKYRKENIFNLTRKTSKSSDFPLVDKVIELLNVTISLKCF